MERACLGVHLPRSVVQIAQVVADLVVAWVEPLSGMATKHLFLLLCLDGFRTSGNSTSRNAGADEAVVVATAVKGNYQGVNLQSNNSAGDADGKHTKGVVEALGLVPVDIKVSQFLRAGRAVRVGSVVNLVGKVGAGHYLKKKKISQ